MLDKQEVRSYEINALSPFVSYLGKEKEKRRGGIRFKIKNKKPLS
jgi:hypothetical protein